MRVTFRSWRPRITIKVLIVVLSMLCVVIVTGSLLVMSFYLSRNVLMQDAQNYNAAYASGRLTVSLSQPIWDEQAKYLGYFTGTIYLQEPNVLGRMLAEHYYRDGSQVYVVDGQACQSPGMPL